MFPEERVLVGVINAKRDLRFLLDDGWYRIPQKQMPAGVNYEYLAFFLSGRVFGEQSGTIPYFARLRGIELATRRELIPSQPNHKRADETYYRLEFGEIEQKDPAITNPTKRAVAFVRTTWDRFVHARTIADLYSEGDYFVDRVYHVLQNKRVPVVRFWDADRPETGRAAHLRVLCQSDDVIISTEFDPMSMFVHDFNEEGEILKRLREEIERQDGMVMVPMTFG